MDEVKGGYENSPCNHCGKKLNEFCTGYSSCPDYRGWLNACWRDFRRFYERYGGDSK